MSILTHDEAKRWSQSSTDPLEVIRNVEAAVIVKLAVSQNALKDEIRLIWKPKCDALRQQLEAAQAEAADGYAARMAEARRYGAMAVALEAAQSRIDFKEMVIEHNAELARLAEIEAGASPVEPSQTQPVFVSESLGHLTASGVPKTIDQFQLALNAAFAAGKVVGASPQPKMVTPYITQEHFDKTFPVNVRPSHAHPPVEPSQAQPPAPGEAAREYMTGYSDCKEWAGATNQAQPSQAPPEPSKYGSPELQALILDKLQQAQPERAPLSDDEIQTIYLRTYNEGFHGRNLEIAFARAIEAAIKQGGQHE